MADATLKLSGYLAAAASAAGTVLDSVADNTWTSLSAEIDNSTNKYPYADWYMELGSAAFTGADSGVEIYIVPCVDGTNYPTWTTGTSDEQENNPYFAAIAPTTGTTAAQKIVNNSGAPLLLPNGKFKFGFRSRANVTLAASGNAFYYRPYGYLGDEA